MLLSVGGVSFCACVSVCCDMSVVIFFSVVVVLFLKNVTQTNVKRCCFIVFRLFYDCYCRFSPIYVRFKLVCWLVWRRQCLFLVDASQRAILLRRRHLYRLQTNVVDGDWRLLIDTRTANVDDCHC
jgi:hypothetical protein